MTPTEKPIKLIYIAGWGRSGSTLMARILGEVEGFFHGGELRTIWVDGFKPKGQCGCGVPVKDCEVWQAVLEKGFSDLAPLDYKALNTLRLQTEPRTHEILMSQLGLMGRQKLANRMAQHLDILRRLYGAVQATTGCSVIVDDSLHPGHGLALSLMPEIQLYIVHLIRDPRATAYSWWKRQKTGLGTYTLKENALGWDLRNAVVDLLGRSQRDRYMRVLYEDFVKNPLQITQSILSLVSETDKKLPFVNSHEVSLDVSHSVFGNPNRTDTGTILIKQDDRWKSDMDNRSQRNVTFLTWPLLMRYGYSFRN